MFDKTPVVGDLKEKPRLCGCSEQMRIVTQGGLILNTKHWRENCHNFRLETLLCYSHRIYHVGDLTPRKAY